MVDLWFFAVTLLCATLLNLTEGAPLGTVLVSEHLANATDTAEDNQAYKHFSAFPTLTTQGLERKLGFFWDDDGGVNDDDGPAPASAPAPASSGNGVGSGGTCPSFTASKTNGGSTNLPFCSIQACPGDLITASMCSTNGGYCSGDTILSLAVQHSDGTYWMVASNDDLCGYCSGLSYSAPSNSVCQTYYIAQGCYGSTSCDGQVKYSVSRPTAGAASAATRKYSLTSNGFIYSTLADVSIDGFTETCQSDPITLPSNWELAPDTVEVRNLIASHPWSTNVAVVSSGVGYRTLNFPPAGQAFGDSQSKFSRSGSSYWTPWCNYQILIRSVASPSQPPPSPTPQLPPSLTHFSVSNTGNAQVNTTRVAIPQVCADTTLTISTCDGGGSFSGDTIIRLLAHDGTTEIGSDDDSCALNGGSKLVYYTGDSKCSDLSLEIGCFNDVACSGRVSVTRSSGQPSLKSASIARKTLQFAVSDTNYAQQNVALARFTQCGPSTISASTCGSFRGDTYLRLRNSHGEVSRNDDSSDCGRGSSLSYQPPANAGCETYTLQVGCFGSGSCSGDVSYSYLSNDRGFYLSSGAAGGTTQLNGGYLFLLGKDGQRIGLSEITVSLDHTRIDGLGVVLGSTDYPFHFNDYYGSNSAFCVDGNPKSVCSTDTNYPWMMVDLTGRSWNSVQLDNRKDCCTSDLANALLAVAVDPRGTQISAWSYLDGTGSRVYKAAFPLSSSSLTIAGSGGTDSPASSIPSSSGCTQALERSASRKRLLRGIGDIELTAAGDNGGGNSCYNVPDWSVSGVSDAYQAPGDPYFGFPSSGNVETMTQQYAFMGFSQAAGTAAGRALPSGLAREGVGAVVGTVINNVLNQQAPSAMDGVSIGVGLACPECGMVLGVVDIFTGGAVSDFCNSFFGSFFNANARQLTAGSQLEWRVNVTIALSTSSPLNSAQKERLQARLHAALHNASSSMSALMPTLSQRLQLGHQTASITSVKRVGTFSTKTIPASQLHAQAHPVYRYVDLSTSSGGGTGGGGGGGSRSSSAGFSSSQEGAFVPLLKAAMTVAVSSILVFA